MNELLIKKYPNRRLYDIERGVYVTLKDLRQLVQGDRSIKIIDANTEVDITRAVLLQVLSEEEQDSAFLTAEHLRRILRLYSREDTARIQSILETALSEAERTTSLLSINGMLGTDGKSVHYLNFCDSASRHFDLTLLHH